jgi:two-component system, chemotaxis family, chemotaxis protein CheY
MSFRVLIVDDSPSMRTFIQRVISLSGLDALPLEASDGIEALEMLDREWVDVILTDINMPRMNGEAMLRQLSERGLTKSIPVIVVSTDSTTVRKDIMNGLGAKGYLIKPFQPEDLRDAIERALGVMHAD